MNYAKEMLIMEVRDKLGKVFPECKYVNIDWGDFSGHISLMFEILKKEKQFEILSRFDKIDKLLEEAMFGDLLRYVINISYAEYPDIGMIIRIYFEFDN